ncbi:ADP-ribosyltransferase [Bacillus mycoides]|uniref:ADP-ribosyltransferase n=1 Tax=Bacillus mycoides TaxID=1405 RepID=UPI003D65B214
MKKRVTSVLTCILLSSMFLNDNILPSHVEGAEQSITAVNKMDEKKGDPKVVHDFEGNKEEAKEWAEDRYSKWQNNELTKYERAEIENYANNEKTAEEINTILEDTRGNILEDSPYKTKIENIDKALKKEKTNQTMYVYQRVNEQYLGLPEGFLKNGLEINKENFQKFKEGMVDTLSIVKINSYMEASLHGESPNLSKEPPIYIRLEIPKDIHSGYIGNLKHTEAANDFLIEKGQAIQIMHATIIHQKGKEFIKLDARLVPQAELEQKLKEYNEKLNAELKLNDKFANLVHMDLTGRMITPSYIQANEIIQSIKNIDKEFLLKLQEEAFKLSPEPNLIIADYKPTEHEAFEHLKGNPKYDESLGIHSWDGGHETIVSLENINKYRENASLTALHELGHAIDDLNFRTISDLIDFELIYNDEKDFFPDDGGTGSHAKSNAQEFFAECFAYYYYPDEEMKEKLEKGAPQTYKFIEELKDMV